ncbi:MAG: hypothetical protein ACXQTR_03435 [Candidatus Methanospirareceae archaeon]
MPRKRTKEGYKKYSERLCPLWLNEDGKPSPCAKSMCMFYVDKAETCGFRLQNWYLFRLWVESRSESEEEEGEE